MLGKKLKIGDTIGIVGISNASTLQKLNSAKENLEKIGFKVVIGESAKSSWYSYSGRDEVRANDINTFFADKNIDAIMSLRGGFGGAARLFDLIDYNIIKKNPKIFIGFSDITSLHAAIFKKTGLATFYGPMAASNFSGNYDKDTLKYFKKILMEEKDEFVLDNPEELKIVREGKASGIIIGGNLTTLLTTIGTKYEYDYTDKILFLEDIGEKTNRIDRMLGQLKNIGVFDKIKGLIIGDFSDSEIDEERDMILDEVFDENFKFATFPVISNLKAGHCDPTITVPFGVKAEIDTDKKQIKILEKVVKKF